ncbi:MAG: F0F1 ATP synthase subunit A [Methylacidiphilales bacterium]|nr:F0F1 ATP synthase subunit A [Candidatus Methylacidiphilales bacterium]
MIFFASVSPQAQSFGGVNWFTNVTLFTILVVAVLVALVQLGLRKIELVPGSLQNFCEWVVEQLYNLVETVVGKRMTPKVFPLLGSFFIFILVGNWIGLLPGVSTIGFGEVQNGVFEVTEPLLRPSSTDLNVTAGLALLFMVIWIYWVFTEEGIVNFLKHIFVPDVQFPLVVKIVVGVIFLFVGMLELLSIALRPITLAVRLFANIFAGENILHAMSAIAGPVWSVVFTFPFYCLELMVGLVQALVFVVLCAVYTRLAIPDREPGGAH